MVDKFGEGRVWVAGGERSQGAHDHIKRSLSESTDAAHTHSPAGGQVCAEGLSIVPA